ncbi:hypothetical protein JKP88DRAFT_262778 [Tribonema minus]|uniref:Pentatricopeptide repeat-containing protein n=1 Tax=Tribonema minus TaxID=303371 RepID=A0A835Z121_9STRA|nr:hypothetical protein JKP88DRAFT_262778 [Tribonema minus]
MGPAASAGQHALVFNALERLIAAGVATPKDHAHHVHACVAAHNVRGAMHALEQMVNRHHKGEMSVFHAVLHANAHCTFTKGGGHVLRLMARCGVAPDLKAYNLALHASRGPVALQQADRILANMAAAGITPDRGTFKGVLHACRMAQDGQRALVVFGKMQAEHPAFANADMWNCLLRAVATGAQPRRTLEVAAQMAGRGVAPNAHTHDLVAGAHAALGDSAAVERVLSSVRAAGGKVPPETLAALAKGYAHGGHMDAAEGALQAVLGSGGSLVVRQSAIVTFLSACRRARDLPRVLRWLRRVPKMGFAPTARMWDVAVNAAHEAGDAAATDALWREAGGAAYFGLYKALVPPKEGSGGPWRVLEGHRAQGTALDLSSCTAGVIHAALRAEAARLRALPPAAALYIYAQKKNSLHKREIAADIRTFMEAAGAHVSSVFDATTSRTVTDESLQASLLPAMPDEVTQASAAVDTGKPLSCRDEYRLNNLGYLLRPGELKLLGRSNCKWLGARGLCFLRTLAFLYLLALLTWAMVDYGMDGRIQFFYIYLTNWELLFETIYFGFAAALSFRAWRQERALPAFEPGTARVKPAAHATIVWVLQDLTYAGTFIVSLVYWSVIFRLSTDAISAQSHAANFVIALLDCLLAASPPVRILHAWVPFVYGTVYIAWDLIHYYTNIRNGEGDRYIYTILDWSDPARAAAATLIMLFVVVPLTHTIMSLVRRLGAHVGARCCCSDSGAQSRWQRKGGSAAAQQPEPTSNPTLEGGTDGASPPPW